MIEHVDHCKIWINYRMNRLRVVCFGSLSIRLFDEK